MVPAYGVVVFYPRNQVPGGFLVVSTENGQIPGGFRRFESAVLKIVTFEMPRAVRYIMACSKVSTLPHKLKCVLSPDDDTVLTAELCS